MLKQRVVTAIVLLVIVYLILFVTPDIVFNAAALILCLMSAYELSVMYKFNVWQRVLLQATIVVLCLGSYFSGKYDYTQIIRAWAVLFWCFVVPIILLWQVKSFSKKVISLFAILIFVPTFYALVMLHSLFGSVQLVSIMAIAWVSDIAAYFVGRKFGKHKLAPDISPKKSIEGAIAGLIGVLIYLAILKLTNQATYLYSYAAWIKFGFILTTASIIGDLFESWFKRVAQVKDSGTLLPGHGGVFDRIDSLVAVVVVAFAMLCTMQ